MTHPSPAHHLAKPASRLNPQELALLERLESIPEFGLAGFQTGEMRTFRGVVIRRGGSVRGLWSFTDGHFRWLPVACKCEPYATASLERAVRHMMILVLKALLVRRAVRRSRSPAETTANLAGAAVAKVA